MKVCCGLILACPPLIGINNKPIPKKNVVMYIVGYNQRERFAPVLLISPIKCFPSIEKLPMIKSEGTPHILL